MRARALIIFAISSILPLLLFLYLLDRYDLVASWEAQLLIGLALGVALVGFLVFRQVVSQICALADRFSRLERGESVEPAAEAGPQEISEIARILDAFNRVLAELKANTRELENLIFKLSTLSELTEIASRIPDIQQVLQIVLQRTMGTVNATIGSIMLLEEDGETLRVTAAQGLDEALVGQATTRIGEGISGKVLQEGVPVLVDDVARDPRFAKENNPRYENGSFICMPLQVKDRKIGVINLAKKGNLSSFSEMDLKFLTTLLNHIGFAVENARLLKEAREAARKLQKAVHQKTSELTQAQQQILQSEKLSALGELVAGVAHEINNPLAVVIGYSQLLMGTQTEEKARRNLSKIAEEAQRASRIVQHLLPFAGPARDPPEGARAEGL
ncbi:MAG: GAF domain-containing protein [Deltaproteobacteria bacterium]|nr:GAF domain-containing protein [Deltaproteobacteria bacterium]